MTFNVCKSELYQIESQDLFIHTELFLHRGTLFFVIVLSIF